MDLRGKRILLTGDSHMDWSRFGNKLEELLRAEGADVVRLAIGGSSSAQWAGTKDICRKHYMFMDGTDEGKKCINPADLVAAGPFDLMIVSMMGNDAGNAYVDYPKNYAANSPTKYISRIKTLLDKVKPKNFLLVGSPTYSPEKDPQSKEYVEAAKNAFGSSFFDSKPVTAPFWGKKGEGDGVHYMGQGAVLWAEAVVKHAKANALEPKKNYGPKIFLAAVAVAAVVLIRRRMRRT